MVLQVSGSNKLRHTWFYLPWQGRNADLFEDRFRLTPTWPPYFVLYHLPIYPCFANFLTGWFGICGFLWPSLCHGGGGSCDDFEMPQHFRNVGGTMHLRRSGRFRSDLGRSQAIAPEVCPGQLFVHGDSVEVGSSCSSDHSIPCADSPGWVSSEAMRGSDTGYSCHYRFSPAVFATAIELVAGCVFYFLVHFWIRFRMWPSVA